MRMAGCSVVVMMIVLWPVFLLLSIVDIAMLAAGSFVSSPAFPCLVASLAFSLAAIIDLARVLWRRWRGQDALELVPRTFTRPAILFAIAFALFAISMAIAGSMALEWWRSLPADPA